MDKKITAGRIVWLTNVIDSCGKPTHDHCAVIITPSKDIEDGKPVRAVYISSKFKDKPEELIVELPHAKGGHPHTKLDRPSAAICDWINKNVTKKDVANRPLRGMIYGQLLIEIVKKSTQS